MVQSVRVPPHGKVSFAPAVITDVHVADGGAAAWPVGPGHPALRRRRLVDRELPGAQRYRQKGPATRRPPQQAPQPGQQPLRLFVGDQPLQILRSCR